MKKIETSNKKSNKKSQKLEVKKQRGLFDHLTAIRTTKNLDYYESLNESERKGFNHWLILHGLSMDINLIPIVSKLWKDGYYDKIPSPLFYRVLVDMIPKTSQKLFWIKKNKKNNTKLLQYLAEWYSISTREAEDYLTIFTANDAGYTELCKILERLGLNDKEAESLLTDKNDYETN